MNTIATRLVGRLVVIQLAVGFVTELFVIVFAPRLLLLDKSVMMGSLTLAAWVAGVMIVLEVLTSMILTWKLRPVLRSLAVGSAAVDPAGLLGLYALPARLATLDVLTASVVTGMTLLSPFRPTTTDLYTQFALFLLTMTMVSAAALPLYIMLRVSVARVLELAPAPAAIAALEMLDVRRSSRVQNRLLAAVAGPVAFVALGASLLVYAHARAFDTAARESDAAELARGAFEQINGDPAGIREAIGVAEQHGLKVTLDRDPAHFTTEHNEEGETILTVPLDTGHAVMRFPTTRLSPVTGVYVLLAFVASALAGILGARLGAAFGGDVALATREVRATGVADVIRGTRIQREARFVSIIALLQAIDELGGVFREFASAQEKSIIARAATERMRGLFLASISHDLKGPLNSILGFAELVRRNRLSDGQLESLAIIEQRGRELLTLIQTILDSARVEANELTLAPELTMVGDVVMSAVLEARDLAVGTSVDIVGEIQPGVPKLYVDPLRVIQALTAVIMSAVRFTDKGRVSVRATLPANASHLRIDVEGSGRGVPSAELEKIFEAFKYADRARRMGSLGLGLSLARSILELHGGSIEVEQMTGGGVMFHVWLPSATGVGSAPALRR
jgi:signal transduction histidine kinase